VVNQCHAFCLCSCLTTYNMLIDDRNLSMCNVSYHFEDNRVIDDNWFTTMLGFRIDDISVEFGGHICQQPVLYKKKYITYDIYWHITMCNVSYHFEDNRVIDDIIKRFYTFPWWMVCKVLQVLIFFQENALLLSETEYNHTVILIT
jgi:hypothetical protein